MDDFSFNGMFDSVSQLAQGYFGMRTAEAQADANGQSQATLANQTESNTVSVNKVPLSASQYQQVGVAAGTSSPAGGLPFGLTKNQLMMGAALLAAVLIMKK